MGGVFHRQGGGGLTQSDSWRHVSRKCLTTACRLGWESRFRGTMCRVTGSTTRCFVSTSTPHLYVPRLLFRHFGGGVCPSCRSMSCDARYLRAGGTARLFSTGLMAQKHRNSTIASKTIEKWRDTSLLAWRTLPFQNTNCVCQKFTIYLEHRSIARPRWGEVVCGCCCSCCHFTRLR